MKNPKPKPKKKKKHVRTNKQKDTKMLTMVTFIKPTKISIRKCKPQQLTRNETKDKKERKMQGHSCKMLATPTV
jgi:hypothetical protein